MEPEIDENKTEENFLSRLWVNFRKLTQAQDTDPLWVQIIKYFFQVIGFAFLILISPVIIVVLLFAFMLSL